MKRILTLALVACFVLSAGLVSAKEMQFTGQFEHALEWTDNVGLQDFAKTNNSEDDFYATQRIRMYFQYVDSEVLRGVVGFEIDTNWGAPAATGTKGTGGGALGTDGTTVEVKHAYTDFNVGGVAFRVGLQGLAWPSAVAGSPIYDNDVAGIVASYQFNDNFGLTAGWARLWDNNIGGDGANGLDDEVDAFTVIAPITMDGWSLTPYVIYAKHGKDAAGAGTTAALSSLRASNASALTDDLDIWWGGGAFELSMFDPFVFGADLIYGSVDGDKANQNDMAGWFFAAIATYKMDMVTPSLALMYGTGED
ncbi:outer membrane homotrimeric porin, partial [Desulfocurvus sp.]|uniref:outer membrane homotrimeric porin n=1 Tax=Desulfocurvus sp. TaxID=2871698 RepID=UPI0025C22634